MAVKQKVEAEVISSAKLADGIFDLWLKTELAADVRAGSFIGVYPKNAATLLPRPISICEAAPKGDALRIVYRVAGAGTAEFSKYVPGEKVDILGILGNGYPLDKAEGKKVMLMGGGIGVPPLLETAKRLQNKDNIIVLGYRDNHLFLKDEFEKYGKVYVATEDGSVGTKGNVLDCVREEGLVADMIFSCGPMPMLRAIKRYAKEAGIPAYLSLEERMACGVGACLGCVCKTTQKDHHSHVNNARICTDGPVFLADDISINPEDEEA